VYQNILFFQGQPATSGGLVTYYMKYWVQLFSREWNLLDWETVYSRGCFFEMIIFMFGDVQYMYCSYVNIT